MIKILKILSFLKCDTRVCQKIYVTRCKSITKVCYLRSSIPKSSSSAAAAAAVLGLLYQSLRPSPHTPLLTPYTQFASVSSIWHSANFTSWLLYSFFFPWSKTHPSWGVGISSICSYFLSPWIFALLGWGSPVPSQKLPAHPLMKYSLG